MDFIILPDAVVPAFNFLHGKQLIVYIIPCISAGVTQSNKNRLNMGRVRGVSHLFGYCFPNRSLTQGLIVAG